MDQFSVKSNLLHQKAPTSRDWPNKLIIFEIDSETFSQCSWVFIDAFMILSNICDGDFRKKQLVHTSQSDMLSGFSEEHTFLVSL